MVSYMVCLLLFYMFCSFGEVYLFGSVSLKGLNICDNMFSKYSRGGMSYNMFSVQRIMLHNECNRHALDGRHLPRLYLFIRVMLDFDHFDLGCWVFSFFPRM